MQNIARPLPWSLLSASEMITVLQLRGVRVTEHLQFLLFLVIMYQNVEHL